MKSQEISVKKNLLVLGVIAGLILFFFLACLQPKLSYDFSSEKYESLAIRLSLAVLVSLFLAWRLKSLAKLELGKGRTVHDLVIITLFVSILFFPMLSQVSYLKKSVRAVKHIIEQDLGDQADQTLALVKEFPSSYEKYTEKNFQLSKLFVYLDALVKVYVLGVSPNTNVAVGKNGFYFEGWGARRVEKGIVENFDNIADYMGQIPMSGDELRKWKRVLEERKYWLRERGSEFVFVLAPTKALVYPEYLPSNLKKAPRGTTRYEQLSSYLNDYGSIHFIDLLPVLKQTKQQTSYPLLFYKTDFHWNYFGAFIAYQGIIAELKNKLPQFDFTSPRLEDFTVDINKKWAHQRFMSLIGLPAKLHMNGHYVTMIPRPNGVYRSAQDLPPEGINDVYPREEVLGKDKGREIKIRALRNPEAKIGTILLLGDSFFEKCVYFFSAEARRLLNYRTVVNFPSELFEYEKPDIVIQEILNMYVLRDPPKNPPGFVESYLLGKFAEGKQVFYLHDRAGSNLQKSVSGNITKYELLLQQLPHSVPGEVQVVKVTFTRQPDKPVGVAFVEDGGEVHSISAEACTQKAEALYCQFPPGPVKKLILSTKTSGESPEISVAAVEVRSDI